MIIRRINIMMLVFIFFLLWQSQADAAFMNPRLNEAVNIELRGSPPTPENLATIKELYLYKKGICDLSGIENLTNLERLEASGNQIINLGPLKNLKNLEVLCLGGNQISDISPLATLTNLRELELFNNNISDISPLTGLQLERLYINNNHISDIGALAAIKTLTVLEVSGNGLPETPKEILDNPIATLKHEQVNYDSEMSPLIEGAVRNIINKPSGTLTFYDLQKVNTLDFKGQTPDLQGLELLSQLKCLVLDNTGISDLTAVGKVPSIESLSLKNNHITDLEPLRALSSLKELYLTGNPIEDYSPLIPVLNGIAKRDFIAVSNIPVNGVINVKHNGKYLIFGEYPYIENGRTLAPARSFLEYFGFNVTWDGKNQIVAAERPGAALQIPVKDNNATVNGKTIPLDVSSRIKNNKVFVPLRFIVEILPLQTQWNPELQLIEVV